jgi:hypothetical protein
LRRLTGQPTTVSNDLDPVGSAPQQRDDSISDRGKVPRQLAQLADRLGDQRRPDASLMGVRRKLIVGEPHGH